jgi:hypothetical protein
MLPRIEASETLAAINRAALCHNVGFESELDRQELIQRLRFKAAGEAPPAPAKAEPADLAGMGIAMRSEGGDLPVITDRDAWLGNSGEPSNG